MTPRAEKRLIAGPAGQIELALDWPVGAAVSGLACVGHPHPLYGGTMDNKVAATIARTFSALGWLALRFNFRGVGASDGTHDAGHGETEDFLHVLRTTPTLSGISEWPMPDVRGDTLVIHGESDETIALAAVLDWARPQGLPVLVIPGADHFFHRRLTTLKGRISAHIRGMSQFDAAQQSH
jgi:alpha/beta superfamily hydrolase